MNAANDRRWNPMMRAALAILACATVGCAQSGHPVKGSHIVTFDAGAQQGADGSLTVLHLPLPADAKKPVKYDQVNAPAFAANGFASVEASADGAWLACASATGGAISIYEIGERRPKLVTTVAGADGMGAPVAIKFHPAEPIVACLDRETATLFFIEIADGDIRTDTFNLEAFAGKGVDPVDLVWSPSGEELVVAFERDGSILRFRVDEEDGVRTLAAASQPIRVARRPVAIAYAPSGEHLIVVDALWHEQPGVTHHKASVAVFSVLLENASGEPEIVARTFAPALPDATTLSADGRMFAIVNARPADLTLPENKLRQGGRVALYRFNPSNGALTQVAEARTCSMPTSLAFDAEGRTLLITDGERNRIQIWRVGRNGDLEFTRTTLGSGENPVAVAVVR